MAMLRRILMAAAVIALAAPVAALGGLAEASGQSPPIQIRRVNVEGYPNVSVTVAVAPGTQPGDLTVQENGVTVPPLSVRPLLESGDEIDVVLALDTSDSVRGAPLEAALRAASDFVSSLPAGVPVGILTFSDRVRVLSPLSSDHSGVLTALVGISGTQRGTALYDAIAAAAGMVSGPSQHNLILLTDGTDVGSSQDIVSADATAKRARLAVFSIGLEGRGTNFPALQEMSRATGGSFFPATTANLSGLYAELSARLARQYIVLYRTGEPRGVQVSVSIHSPAGQDTSFVLMPRAPVPPAPDSPSRPLLSGTVGLLTVLALAFAAAFLTLFLSLSLGGRGRRDRELARRMSLPDRPDAPAGPVTEGRTLWIPEPLVAAAERLADASGLRAGLDRKLERAALAVRPGEILAGSALAAAAGALLGGVVLHSLLFVPVFAIPGGAIPFIWLNRRVSRRLAQLDNQLPDVLMILASSLRAGHSFLQALDSVAKEIGDPAGPEFNRVVTEIRLGRRFEDALNAMAERVGTEEFRWAVMAVNVQHEVGGNLAEILDILAETVRERQAIRRQVKVLAGEGVLSMRILIVLPFLLTLYIVKINPSYMKLLWTTRIGWFMIAIASALMAIGILWARKVVKIDV